MRVVVASHNPVKIDAVRKAFSIQFPGNELEVVPAAVSSGVSEQPQGDEETRQGARNRARNAMHACPEADFWVGLEGGVEAIDGQLMTFAWIAIRGRGDRIGLARTATLPLPPAIKELVDSGIELGPANDRVFSTTNSKQGGGAFGLLTNGRYTREFIYRQTLIIALVPFVHELYPHSQATQD